MAEKNRLHNTTFIFNLFVVFVDPELAEYAAKDPEAGYEVIGQTDPYTEYWTVNECDMIRNFKGQPRFRSNALIASK